MNFDGFILKNHMRVLKINHSCNHLKQPLKKDECKLYILKMQKTFIVHLLTNVIVIQCENLHNVPKCHEAEYLLMTNMRLK